MSAGDVLSMKNASNSEMPPLASFGNLSHFNLDANTTGNQILKACHCDPERWHAYDIVNADLGVKSPATLMRRANVLLAFMSWFTRVDSAVMNPFLQHVVWEYFQFL